MSESGDRLMVAFVDALGPAQLDALASRLPWLSARRDVEGILGYSSGALATVLTGAPPMAHGRMCLFTARDPDTDSVLAPLRWLGLLPRVLHERGRLRRAVARRIAARSGLSGYVALHRVPPEAWRWLDLPERDDLFTTESVDGVPTFLADARRAGLSVYAAPWQLPEKERWAHAHEALSRQRPDLAFLYCAELDAALHRTGPGGLAATAALDRVAAHLERARQEMEAGGGRITTLVVGDHGMAEVERVVDPRPVLRDVQTRYFVDSTMLRFWGDDRALSRARLATEGAAWPGRWLDEAALAERGAPTVGAPYGRHMFLLDEGVIFAPSWVGGRVRGMHGYDPSSASACAALASDAPLPGECGSLQDLAGVVRARLGLAA